MIRIKCPTDGNKIGEYLVWLQHNINGNAVNFSFMKLEDFKTSKYDAAWKASLMIRPKFMTLLFKKTEDAVAFKLRFGL